MNRTMNTVAVLAVAGLMASGATAFGAESSATNQTHAVKAKGAGLAASLQELTLTGIVAKNEIKVAGKDRTVFVLITASGAKLHLPMAKAGKKATAAPEIQLANYVGQNVKVVAMGTEKKKGDKTVVRVKTLKTIEKVAA